jgi:hypothetical protein
VPRPIVGIQKMVLLAPDSVAQAAAARARRAEERWLLRQPRAVRRSYVREVLDSRAPKRADEIWMLRQPTSVRETYVREVLEA